MKTLNEKIDWMGEWCDHFDLALDLEGEVGHGRPCVGITNGLIYVDYGTTDEEGDIIVDSSIWTPRDAYHKHPCVAVLGTEISAINQLYDWLRWFDDHGYRVERSPRKPANKTLLDAILLGRWRLMMIKD